MKIANDDLKEKEVEYYDVNIAVETTIHNVKFVGEAVQGEDDEQKLYTLDPAKANAVKLPTFEGRDDEDFAEFRENVDEAFVQNRVSRSDRLEKLREVLRGHAKRLVSQLITNKIDEAWDILEKAFGDPIRPINNRKDSLLKLPPKVAVEEDESETTELDLQEVSLHHLVHSSKNLRGRLVTSTEIISSSSVEVFKRFVPKISTGRMMFYKASLLDLPGKLTSGKFGRKRLRNIQARKRKCRILKDYSKLKTFQVYVPDVKEAKELFDDKKPTDDESDDKLIDVHRQRLACFEFGVHEKIKPEDTDVPGTEEMFDDKKQGPRSQVLNDDEQGILYFKETKLANVEELEYSSEDKLVDMEMDISGYEVFDNKHSKDEEGLLNAKEHDLKVEDLHLTEKETITEDSGNDEVLVDKGMDLIISFKCGLRESNILDEEAKGEETDSRILLG